MGLKLPRFSHHDVEVDILIYGRRHADVIIKELIVRHLKANTLTKLTSAIRDHMTHTIRGFKSFIFNKSRFSLSE